LEALGNNGSTKMRLDESQGFAALLKNMKCSGDIILKGEIVKASPRGLRKARQTRSASN
jgi:hypothetical protein